MLQKDRLVKHKEYGLGMINNDAPIVDDVISVYFSSCIKLVQKSELTETNIKIDRCFKINNKTFFNLHEVEQYLDKKEYEEKIGKLCYDYCPTGLCKSEINDFITENADELRTILNKYKHL